MSMLDEFKTFALRGNVLDLAVGVVIGAAFGAIVTSLVGDVIMPVIGLATGGIDLSKAALVLKPADEMTKAPAVLLSYGKFLQAILSFLIIAFVIFLLVKGINTATRRAPPAPPAPALPTAEEKLLMEIRDLLRKQ